VQQYYYYEQRQTDRQTDRQTIRQQADSARIILVKCNTVGYK